MSEKRVLAGTYEIIGYLQSGSGGDVYKAYHRRLKKEVILKKIRHKGVSMNINRQEVDILKRRQKGNPIENVRQVCTAAYISAAGAGFLYGRWRILYRNDLCARKVI